MSRLLPLLCLLVSMFARGELLIAVPQDVLTDYQRLVAGRDVQAITDYSGPGARRDTVEMILLQQALRLGGSTEAVRFSPLNSYARIFHEVENGRVAGSGTSVWAADAVDRKVQLSSAVIEEGEYVVGLYTVADNAEVLTMPIAKVLKQTAVTNRAWVNDYKVLQQLGFAHIESAPTFPMIARMLNAGRAQVTLMSFKPTPDLSSTLEGIKLVPLPGVKVAMSGSRHFIFASTPAGDRATRALNAGLARLRTEGRIRRAYEAGGFFNARVNDWTLLNPPRH
ncbi:hypothetical protein GCM10007860_16940 [Chitiniphilus shinanonensis]|uniref:Solute-binding protein family 3/N-terminal domain-containing protein n=1 Tax=Chitiniphilus shinanonensis TaxID=553088 RepID=A0ABQ6BT72_9NEIS|nr:hypothetical protein [Chitiniphilus shinanonensis]GLS04547.1 hypothetical protein GCM10007860_16940 [Chitiniphilus shinanonensis]